MTGFLTNVLFSDSEQESRRRAQWGRRRCGAVRCGSVGPAAPQENRGRVFTASRLFVPLNKSARFPWTISQWDLRATLLKVPPDKKVPSKPGKQSQFLLHPSNAWSSSFRLDSEILRLIWLTISSERISYSVILRASPTFRHEIERVV